MNAGRRLGVSHDRELGRPPTIPAVHAFAELGVKATGPGFLGVMLKASSRAGWSH